MKLWLLNSGIEVKFNGNLEDLIEKYSEGNFERLETLKDSLGNVHHICRYREKCNTYIIDITKE